MVDEMLCLPTVTKKARDDRFPAAGALPAGWCEEPRQFTRGAEHLRRIVDEAQTIVDDTLGMKGYPGEVDDPSSDQASRQAASPFGSRRHDRWRLPQRYNARADSGLRDQCGDGARPRFATALDLCPTYKSHTLCVWWRSLAHSANVPDLHSHLRRRCEWGQQVYTRNNWLQSGHRCWEEQCPSQFPPFR